MFMRKENGEWNVNEDKAQNERKQQTCAAELYKPISENNYNSSIPSSQVLTSENSLKHDSGEENLKEENKDVDVPSKSIPITVESPPLAAQTKLENGEITMVQEANPINDGADEQMLGTEENEKLAEKRRDEVKFIKGGDHQNGDAKIDIGAISAKEFTGMTKEELMKYANDPFWVRLRWIFFIAFWAIWVAMLIGAILIIIDAPKCAAPVPLPSYQRGLLAKFKSIFENEPTDLAAAQKLQATGVIYELPAELTYSVHDAEVEQKIKKIVEQYKDSDARVILDITPNYVTSESKMMQEAMQDRNKRSAFVWLEQPQVPSNWLSIENGSAWAEVQRGNFVLSQFGDGLYDLRMNDIIVQEQLKAVLKHLIELGVQGVRLKNTKFFIIAELNVKDEVPSNDPKYIHTQYGFWTHSQTTFQEGLGDVLNEYLISVKNASADAFLSVSEDIVRPEVYLTKNGNYGIDMPMYGRFTQVLSAPQGKQLQSELLSTMSMVGNNTWLQWNMADISPDSDINPSAFDLFMSLLPGVPVVAVDSAIYRNVSSNIYKHIKQLRLSPSYMHGNFIMHNNDDKLVAYSRTKSGNPGYFVAFNPTDHFQKGNYSNLGLPEKMTVDSISENYNVTDISVKSKVLTDNVEASPFSTIIFTYVPLKSG